MERYHATTVLSLTARHPARAGRTPGTAPDPRLGLISRDLSSAAPLHFLSNLRDDVDARGFL